MDRQALPPPLGARPHSPTRSPLPSPWPPGEGRPEDEFALTREILEMVHRADVAADLTSVISFYVALKSKPLVVLFGPRDTGKLSLVRVVARVLTGTDGLRYQEMVGHAWWAANCRGMAVLTQAQARFNAEKVLALVEETLLSQDAGSMSMACLAHISPAE